MTTTIKDIIKKCAQLSNRDDIASAINEANILSEITNTSLKNDIIKLIQYYNFVLENIYEKASLFLPRLSYRLFASPWPTSFIRLKIFHHFFQFHYTTPKQKSKERFDFSNRPLIKRPLCVKGAGTKGDWGIVTIPPLHIRSAPPFTQGRLI